MSEPNVLYLEVDEDITSAIDKLGKAGGQQISVVVPKRSSLLQSLINLKLLKKAADEGGQKLMLITADKTAANLAGQIGLSVAEKVGGQPVSKTAAMPEPEAPAEIIEGEDDTLPPAAAKEMEATPPVAKTEPKDQPADDGNLMTKRAITPDEPPAGDEPKAKARRIPDFNSMQKRLLWAGLAVVVAIGLWVANYLLASAKVTLVAKGAKTPVAFDFTIDPAAKTSDPAQAVIAGTPIQLSKDVTAAFTATGQKDKGTKATGTIKVTNNCYNPGTLAAGTTFTASGKSFTSDAATAIPDASVHNGNCSATAANVSVTATQNGGDSNLAKDTVFTIAGVPSSGSTYMTAQAANQFGGGTTKIATVVTQADVDKAKADALAKDKDQSQKDLELKTAAGQQAISESFAQDVGAVTSNPAVDGEATQATLTIKVTYSEFTVAKADYKQLIGVNEQKSLGDQNQIYDDGAASAKLTAGAKDPSGKQGFHFSTDAFSGPKLDLAAIAKQLQGKRYGDAADMAAKLPGVDRAEISLWPSWNSRLPHLAKHIKITIKVSGQ